MGVEVEVKVKIQDEKTLIGSLEKFGFVPLERVVETDVYYTASHHDFAALDEALRVRKIENLDSGEKNARITYKGAKLDSVSMSRQELETGVENADICKAILEQIGFQTLFIVEKRRTSYRWGIVTACVDQVAGLGKYLELEILVEQSEKREEALHRLEEILKKLGYSMQMTTRVSYLEMLIQQSF